MSMLASAVSRSDVVTRLRDIASLAKPRLSSLVIITAAGGMWLAPGVVEGPRALLTLLATAVLVGAANAVNCYLERDTDALMARTSTRPLAAGRLDPTLTLLGALTAGALALVTLALAANLLTSALGLIAFVTYVSAYTPLKRHSALSLLVGAVPGAIPPLMGWTALTGQLDSAGLVLFGILFVWQIPHFIAISLYRREEYARAGLRVFSLVAGERLTKAALVITSASLVPITLALTPLGVTQPWFTPLAAVLGAGYTVVNLAALWGTTSSPRWARGAFHASLVYLTLLFAAIALGAR